VLERVGCLVVILAILLQVHREYARGVAVEVLGGLDRFDDPGDVIHPVQGEENL